MLGASRRTRSSKTEWCQRCETRTLFLFDHGDGMFICSECELQ